MMITACNSAMSTIINLIIGAVVGMLGGYIRYLIKKQKEENVINECLVKGVMWLLHDILEPAFDEVINRGFAYLDEYENLKSQFEIYEGLGGKNGIKQRMTIIEMLPKKPRGCELERI